MTTLQDNPYFMAAFVVCLFAIFFPLLWCGIIYLLGGLGGWRTLAAHYGTSNTFMGQMKSGRSLSLKRGWFPLPFNYSAIVSLGVNRDTLYVNVMRIFRLGHPALRVPVSDISVSQTRLAQFFPMVRLQAAQAPSISIDIRTKDLAWIESITGPLTRQTD